MGMKFVMRVGPASTCLLAKFIGIHSTLVLHLILYRIICVFHTQEVDLLHHIPVYSL